MEYTSSLEDLSELRKRVSVKIPAEKYSEEIKKALAALAEKVTIKGFRPGKAPRQLIEKMYGERARLDTVDRLVNESFQAVLKENHFSLLGDPEMEIQNIEVGSALTYAATFTIFPKPSLSAYDHFELSVEKREASDEDVEQVLYNVQRSKATLKKVEDRSSVMFGDVVEGELRVSIEGKGIAERPEPFFVKIGDKRLPEVLENGIVGMQVGETKDVVSKIPEEHQDEEMRGKSITYAVTVKGISDEILPDLTDELVKTIEGPEETVLELKMSIRQRIDEDYEDMAREQVKSKVLEQLVSSNEFEVPSELIDDEIRNMVVQRGLVKVEKGRTVDIEPFRDTLNAEALRRVKAAIIIDCIAEKESMHAKNEDIEQHMRNIAEAYGVSIDEIRKFYAKEGRLVGVFIEITRRKVLEFLSDRASVTYVTA